jgi:hypothetical protein
LTSSCKYLRLPTWGLQPVSIFRCGRQRRTVYRHAVPSHSARQEDCYDVFQGMQFSVKQGIIDLFTLEFGETWTKKYGRKNYVSLKQAVDLIDSWGFDTFIIGQFNNVKLNGKGYDPQYENTKKFVSVEMFSISRSHRRYLCIVSRLRSSPHDQAKRLCIKNVTTCADLTSTH